MSDASWYWFWGGFSIGASAMGVLALCLMVELCRYCLSVLDKHEDWLRRQVDRRDEGDWWKGDP